MSKIKNLLHSQISNQGILFDNQIAEGGLDLSLPLRSELARALSKCNESRWQIAARISELTRRDLSKDMLDKFCSSNTAYRIAAEILPAFCLVTQSLGPFEILLKSLDCEIIDPLESKQIRLGKLVQKRARIEAEIAVLKHELDMKEK